MKYGIILFGHGSRDPLWRLPLEAVCKKIKHDAPTIAVACAYLELTTPSLAEAVETQLQQNVATVRIVPMFLGVGRHARDDLPILVNGLRLTYPQISFEVQSAVGEQTAVINLLADIALTGLNFENQ